MKISLEPYSDELIEELTDLFNSNCEEISIMGRSVNPDLNVYRTIASANKLLMYIAREDFAAIGYSVFIVSHHPHYKDMIVAEQNMIFLDKLHRKGMAGMKLIKYAEEHLKENNLADCIIQHTNIDKRDLSKLYERMGYQEMSRVFMRMI